MDPTILEGISRIGGSVGASKSCPDDDIIDRINHTYTINIMIFSVAIVLSRQLVGKPISCWIPNDFTGAQGNYAETVCWVTSTYFIAPVQATVPIQKEFRYEKTIYYYQWVPFILMIQAMLFVVPCIIWRLFNTQSRINLRTVMDVTCELRNVTDSLDQRHDLISCLVRHLEDALAIRHYRRKKRQRQKVHVDQSEYGKGWGQQTDEHGAGKSYHRFSTPVVPLIFSKQMRFPGPRGCNPASSSYLCGLYLTVKLLYVLNSITQFLLTGKYLSGTTFLFGINTLIDLLNTRFWDHTGSFPRVALCDFELRRMGSNQHRYTIQCVLRVNIFNEKIYIFLWFWFLFVSILNALSLARWSCRIILSSQRIQFIRRLVCVYFNTSEQCNSRPTSQACHQNNFLNTYAPNMLESEILNSKMERTASKIFTEDILGQDGVFLLRIVKQNVGESTAAEITGIMWRKFRTSIGTKNKTQRQLSADIKPPVPPRKLSSLENGKEKISSDLKSRYDAIQECSKNSDTESESSRPTVLNIHDRYNKGRRHESRFSEFQEPQNTFDEDCCVKTETDLI